MRKATRIASAALGISAGLAGLEHGYFEILQGNVPPVSLIFSSIGLPCIPGLAWNRCEPAMTVLPNLLVTGILSVSLGLALIVWSAILLRGKWAGAILMLLSAALLLFGGGLFPPLIGLVGGAAATQIERPLGRSPGKLTAFAARLWPWPLVIFLGWVWGQFVVGYFFNDWLQGMMGLGLLVILSSLPLSVYAAYARDATHAAQGE